MPSRIPRANQPAVDPDRVLALARETLEIEARALLELPARQGEGFVAAVRAMLACEGRVVVTGMGKSGHVGRKIAATLASTGTPAFFLHPGEASHGDLGMVTARDVVLAISNSGEAEELSAILPLIARLGATTVAMTGNPASTLARQAAIVLSSAVDREACPLDLAPTASTTAQMALGDALAIALLDARGFQAEDFARSHPGGRLGRRLMVHVADVMRTGDALPTVGREAGVSAMLREMTSKGFGFTAVVDPGDAGDAGDAGDGLAGIFTDGDLRRLLETGADLRALRAGDAMHAGPRTIGPDALAAEAAALMERHRITGLLVVDAAGRLVGALNSNDLMRAKVI